MNTKLIQCRKERGMNQGEVAEIFGVAQQTYCQWETGKTRTPKMAMMLIHYMNIPPLKSISEVVYQPERDGSATS